VDIDQGFVFGVIGVKVRWIVVLKKHFDYDTEESANFRHEEARASKSEKYLPVVFR
jgi:hypothetical protein